MLRFDKLRHLRANIETPYCGVKLLKRLRNKVRSCAAEFDQRLAFQACSIDHSDISPFRINDLRAGFSDYRTRRCPSEPFLDLVCTECFDADENNRSRKLCQTSQCPAITYGDLARCAGPRCQLRTPARCTDTQGRRSTTRRGNHAGARSANRRSRIPGRSIESGC